MSLNYAASLSPYANKGKCGLPENFDSIEDVTSKCEQLANLIKSSKSIVCLTGAGISTSCGIPDFRGPNGVWTLEKKGIKIDSDQNISFESAKPSYTHNALTELNRIGKLDFLISQNIDGLHMRSGFPMSRLAELHGNMFLEKCNQCMTKYINKECVKKIGLKPSGKKCTKQKAKGCCRGELLDTVLDWDDELPLEEMRKSELNCKNADLCICLGTTLQILPVGGYPLLTKKNNGKVVIINLQETRIDSSADLIINNKLDMVFEILFEKFLKIKIEPNIINIKLDSNDDNIKHHLNVSQIKIDPTYEISKQIRNNSLENKVVLKEEGFPEWQPHLILLFSGKRKSGKSYIAEKLVKHLNEASEKYSVQLIALASPLKEEYAQIHDLDYKRMLDSSEYKERYRVDMIKWSDGKRLEDPYYFCKIAVRKISKNFGLQSKKFNVWIVTDLRLQIELKYFEQHYPGQFKTIRVLADDLIRSSRNWIFTKGADDCSSECDLDSMQDSKPGFDFTIKNNNDKELNDDLEKLTKYLSNMLEIMV